MWMQDAPVSADMLHALGKEAPSQVAIPQAVPAIFTLQKRFDLPEETEGIDHVEASAYYPEKRFATGEVDEERYDRAHAILIGKEVPEDREEAVACIADMYPDLKNLIRLTEDERWAMKESEKKFTHALRDFVKKLILFTQGTDRVMDFAGRQNIVFFREENVHNKNTEWSVKLLDAIQPEAHLTMNELVASSKLILDRVRRMGREYANELESGMALNPLNTLRIINALAILADIPERYEIPELKRIHPATWRNGMKQQFLQ
jgi:hypothetical protein